MDIEVFIIKQYTMGKFIITEEEKNHIKGLYEQSSGTTSGTTGAHSEFKQIDIKEDSEGTLLSNGRKFTDVEGMGLKQKQFKVNSNYNVATLKHPKTGKIYTVTPSTKYDSGLKITYDGGSYEGPHDACDVKIDKIIGYKSLEGGYVSDGKTFNDAEGSWLKAKGFRILPDNNYATMRHPRNGMIYSVRPSTKYDVGGFLIVGTYEGPHNECEEVINQIIK